MHICRPSFNLPLTYNLKENKLDSLTARDDNLSIIFWKFFDIGCIFYTHTDSESNFAAIFRRLCVIIAGYYVNQLSTSLGIRKNQYLNPNVTTKFKQN